MSLRLGVLARLSRPKSSARACRNARCGEGMGLKLRRFAMASSAKTRTSRSCVWAQVMLLSLNSLSVFWE